MENKHPLLTKIVDRLFKVDSIVTLSLTAVACYATVVKIIPSELFAAWFMYVIKAYYDKQSKKEITEKESQ